MKVRDEIKKFASKENKPVLLWLLSKYSLESQWRFVANCKFDRYGTQSCQVNRIWEPTNEGLILYKHHLTAEKEAPAC